MSSTDSTAIPEHSPQPQAGGSPTSQALPSPARLLYWSVRRELWENRWIYIVPLIVAGVFLFGFAIVAVRVPLTKIAGLSSGAARVLERPFDFASGVLMLTYMVVGVIYCCAALHNERQDRSILFWKSLPVSDLTTVLAKASIPIVALPVITFAVIVCTQGIMSVIGSAILLGRGASPGALWAQVPLLTLWLAMLYHLVTVHTLYYAPFYGWFLLVSGWARRATFLWATLPVVAVLILEKLVFDSSAFAHILLAQLGGGPAAVPFPPPHNMPMETPTLANLGSFLASAGLWIGLAICAIFLAAAVRLRRFQGPI